MIEIEKNFQPVPTVIDDVLKYGKKYLNNVLIYNIKTIDSQGEETLITLTKKNFFIDNITKESNSFKFNWSFLNYSTNEITFCLEIIDDKYNLLYQSDYFVRGYQVPLKFYKVFIPLGYLNRNKKYYYRVRAFNNKEIYNYYFPNQRGNEILDIDKLKQLFEKNIDGGEAFIDNYIDKKINEGTLSNDSIKYFLTLLTNPIDNSIIRVDNNSENYVNNSIFSNYAENLNEILHGKKSKFSLKEDKHFKSNNYLTEMFIDGKKMFSTDYIAKEKFDGLVNSYINSDVINQDSVIELESYYHSIKDSEKILCKYLLKDENDIKDLYSKGINVYSKKIGSYHRESDLIVFVKFRNSNSWQRVNPFRTKLDIHYNKENSFYITVRIKDNYITKPGTELMIVSNNILKKVFFKIDALNKLSKDYQVPCYFIPYSFITDSGEFINDLSNDLENIDIFIDGYRLYNDVDYTVLNPIKHLQLPSMILFKDIVNFDSKIEIVHRNSAKNSIYFSNSLIMNNNKSYIVLPDGYFPFIDKTFSVYINNRKVPEDCYRIINKKTLALENISSNKNILVKFYYEENNKLTEKLLQLYNQNENIEDKMLDLNGVQYCIDEWLKNNKQNDFKEKITENYIGLKYISQLSIYFKWLKTLYDSTKENKIIGFDANNDNLYQYPKKNLLIKIKENLPTYFNHLIKLNANRDYSSNRMEDNISITNISRIFQIFNYVDTYLKEKPNEDIPLDCNKDDSTIFDVFLNENVPIIVPYINNNILIDCNNTIDINNFEINNKGCDY